MAYPRLKRIAQNLALSAGSLVICVALLEGVLRWSGYGKLEIYQPDPVLFWKLRPNQNCYTKIDHKPVHINSHGTRGPEFQETKPVNTIRILSLGDSRTFGWGLTEAETYSGLIQARLQQRAGNRKIEVINAGVNAWSYPQMLAFFRETGLKYRPDIVLVAGANLWTQFSEKSSPEFVRKFMNRVRLKNFLRRFALYHYFVEVKLKEVYERQRTKFIPVDPSQDPLFKDQQQKDPDAVFRNAIEDLCRLAITNGIKPVLLYIPTADGSSSTNLDRLLRVETEISQRLNVRLVDCTVDLAGKGKELYLDADPVHPNVKGNQLIAGRLFETMDNLVAR